MHTGNPPTMKDVAREAGVSLGTVSKVINGLSVGEHYRIRVQEAATKLGYQVNNYARGLKTNKTHCVALVMPSLRHPFFAALTDELISCLMRSGYRSLLMTTNFDSVTEKNCFTLARQNKIDGIIALSYSPNLEIDDAVPVVTFDRHFSPTIPCVSCDNAWGGELAARKLLEFGCQRLLFIGTSAYVYGEADKRADGFCHACRQADVPFKMLVLDHDEVDAPLYSYLDAHILRSDTKLDGIFCHSDRLALRVCEYLRAHGVRVPEDVQIVGFDGIPDFFTKRYPCSTIVQPISEMAETAVALLLRGENTLSPSSVSLPVYFAPGGTTKE